MIRLREIFARILRILTWDWFEALVIDMFWPRMKPETRAYVREWVESLLIALLLALVIRSTVVQAYKIPTGSMRSTLLERDRILVNKFIYRFKEPRRGDIIVFRYPVDKKRDFIKRLVGLPGDRVQIQNGNLLINGLAPEDARLRQHFYYNAGPYGAEGKTIEVPPGYYFALGDNSASSKDGRYWGYVPKKFLRGKAFIIYWPPNRFHLVK